MRYRGIIITGTSASGKTSIAMQVSGQDARFVVAQAVTTRPRREEDRDGAYHYVSGEEIDKLRERNEFLILTSYRGNQYGITRSAVENIETAGKTPILVITPESAARLDRLPERSQTSTAMELPQFLSVFIDARDSALDLRLRHRDAISDAGLRDAQVQREQDRRYKDSFLYSIENSVVDPCVELVIALWDYSAIGGMLSARLIRLMIECGQLLEDASIENVESASYDLRLGEEYYYGGHIRQLTDNDPILLIEPYDYAIVTSKERADFPRDVCGRFDLSVGLFCAGVVLSNGPQVDPGFRGPLFCLLFNTSSSPVLLRRGQHYATLEFHRLIEPSFAYRGPYRDKRLIDYLPSSAARGAINELKQELEQIRRESQTIQNFTFAALSLILALIAILIVFK